MRHPSLQILDALAARGVPRIRAGLDLNDVDWDAILAFPHSRGEKLLTCLAYDWVNGHRPDVTPVLAGVDRGYQAVVADALDTLETVA